MALAVIVRIGELDKRPMHTDEAVHAIKLGQLLEKGEYHYDSNEYHGPTLNYFTLIPAWLMSANSLQDVSEFTLRIVPVVFGVLLILMTFILLEGLSFSVVIYAAVLAAISPGLVFYSRYYIQEMLLVCFTFGMIVCGYRYTKNKNLYWAVTCGVFAGLMHATKETCIIAFFSMAFAIACVALMEKKQDFPSYIVKSVKLPHIFVGLFSAVVISFLFYSSFLTNPSGFADSFRTYATYFNRASENSFHIHPWYYYLDLLTYIEGIEKAKWNEDFIVVFGLLGSFFALREKGYDLIDRKLIRFFAFYTLIMIVIYSAIPYKTPWCLLGFLHGLTILSAYAVYVIFESVRGRFGRAVLGAVVLIFGIVIPVCQCSIIKSVRPADPTNPYIYAHTSEDIFKITDRIREVANVNPEAKDMYIQVVCSDDDYWPLPWYLRDFTRVSWQNKIDLDMPIAPLIICSSDIESEMIAKLYNVPKPGERDLYVPLFDDHVELRPSVELQGLITKDLLDKMPVKNENIVK
jgi:uncharacterized protein (TIGR03663 family)